MAEGYTVWILWTKGWFTWNGMEHTRFHVTENGIQFKGFKFRFSNIFHLIFLDHDWPQVTETTGSKDIMCPTLSQDCFWMLWNAYLLLCTIITLTAQTHGLTSTIFKSSIKFNFVFFVIPLSKNIYFANWYKTMTNRFPQYLKVEHFHETFHKLK